MPQSAVPALLQRIALQALHRDPVPAGEAASTHHGAAPPGQEAAGAAPRAGQGQRAGICSCIPGPGGRSPPAQASHRGELPEEASAAGAAGESSPKPVTALGTAGRDSAGGARQPSALHSAATRLGGAGRPTGPPEWPRPAGSAGTRPATPAAGQRSVPAGHRSSRPGCAHRPIRSGIRSAGGCARPVSSAGAGSASRPPPQRATFGCQSHRRHRRGWLGQTVRWRLSAPMSLLPGPLRHPSLLRVRRPERLLRASSPAARMALRALHRLCLVAPAVFWG